MITDFPWLVGARLWILVCVIATVALVLAIVLRVMQGYEHAFVHRVSATLRYNFIIANPRKLFAVSVIGTVIGAALAHAYIGPVGMVLVGIAGLSSPGIVLSVVRKRRVKRFIYQLPDALLALASALRAGSNLAKGLELLATRQPAPLSQEFTIVLAEYRIGRQLSDALHDLRARINSPEIDLMNTAVNVSRRVGGNLADTLESLAKTLQEKAHIEGKIDALTSMGRAQGWVVGLLPLFIGFVLYQQQPERMSLLFTEWYGWIVLAVVCAMMALAAWMIRKIVNIDV